MYCIWLVNSKILRPLDISDLMTSLAYSLNITKDHLYNVQMVFVITLSVVFCSTDHLNTICFILYAILSQRQSNFRNVQVICQVGYKALKISSIPTSNLKHSIANGYKGINFIVSLFQFCRVHVLSSQTDHQAWLGTLQCVRFINSICPKTTPPPSLLTFERLGFVNRALVHVLDVT